MSFSTSISNQIWRNIEVKWRWKRTWFSVNSQVASCFSLVHSGRKTKKCSIVDSNKKGKKVLFSSDGQKYVSQLGVASGRIPFCFSMSELSMTGQLDVRGKYLWHGVKALFGFLFFYNIFSQEYTFCITMQDRNWPPSKANSKAAGLRRNVWFFYFTLNLENFFF